MNGNNDAKDEGEKVEEEVTEDKPQPKSKPKKKAKAKAKILTLDEVKAQYPKYSGFMERAKAMIGSLSPDAKAKFLEAMKKE